MQPWSVAQVRDVSHTILGRRWEAEAHNLESDRHGHQLNVFQHLLDINIFLQTFNIGTLFFMFCPTIFVSVKTKRIENICKGDGYIDEYNHGKKAVWNIGLGSNLILIDWRRSSSCSILFVHSQIWITVEIRRASVGFLLFSFERLKKKGVLSRYSYCTLCSGKRWLYLQNRGAVMNQLVSK